LIKDPHIRLGAGGVQEIKGHPWFFDIDFELLYEKKVAPPFLPHLKADVDVEYFDDYFTKMPLD